MAPSAARKRLDLERIAAGLGGLAALAFIAAFVMVALSRASYPFELEWLEGGVLQEVRRILAGQALYAAPTPDYIPFIYAPLYFYLGAAASLLGGGFLPLRLLSFACALGCLIIVFLWIRKDGGRPAAALMAAGLFAAAFKPAGFWFDLARVDSLFLLLCLLGLRLLAAAPTPGTAAAAAACLAAAFQTKQSAFLVVACMLPYVLMRGRAYATAFLAVAALGIPGAAWLINKWQDGWYAYYVFQVPSGHAWLPRMRLDFWTHDLLAVFPLPMLLAGLALWERLRARDVDTLLFRLGGTAGMLGIAWLSRLHTGGWDNVLMPAYAWLALMAGWALAEKSLQPRILQVTLVCLLLLQFARLHYDPFAQIPKAADAAAGREAVERIAALPGDVYLPEHGYLAALAGKPQGAHRMAFQDILRGKGGSPAARAAADFAAALATRKYSALILDNPDWEDEEIFPAQAGAHYRLRDSLAFAGERTFMTLTGVKMRPGYVFEPVR